MKKKKNEYKPQRFKKIFRNILSVFSTLILAAFFVIIGYSVAKPFGEIGESKPEITQPVSEAELSTDETYLNNDKNNEKQVINAYWLKDIEFESIDTLTAVLDTVSNEYNTFVVPLKLEGGKLNFNSSYDGAVLAEVTSEIPLNEIYSAIKRKGFTPVASIDTMHDNLYPLASKNSGFILKESKKLWYDKQDQTGKPWLNPVSTDTTQYLSAITSEIAQAGFEYIICTNVEYPAFSEYALEEIGESVNQSDRYLNLVYNVNDMAKAAQNRNSELWLEIPVDEMLKGTCEVFYKPIVLSTQKYILKIDLSKFNQSVEIDGKKVDFTKMSYTEKIEAICTATEKYIYKTSYIPEIITSNFNSVQINEIKTLLNDLGFDSFIIK